MKGQKAGRAKKALPSSKIQIEGGKWITARKFANSLKRGEKTKVTNRSKKTASEVKKIVQSAEKSIKKTKVSPVNDVRIRKQNKGGKPEKLTVRRAEPIKIYQSEINTLRKMVRKPNGTYYSKDFYIKILKQQKAGEVDMIEFLQDLGDKMGGLNVVSESETHTYHFQTGSFVDRVSDSETGKGLKNGAVITVIDLQGDEHNFTSVGNANKLMAELNSRINENIRYIQNAAQKKRGGKAYPIYIQVSEMIKSSSLGFVTAIKYDFTDLKIQGIDQQTFDYYLNED